MTFEIYKKGQGNVARMVTGIGALALAGFGCVALRNYIASPTWRWHFGALSLEPGVVIAFIIFLACAALVAWQALTGRWIVDFVILTEAELRKVSWPTRRDLYQQTVVVIVVSIMLGVMILIADLIFSKVLHLVKII